MYRVEIMEDGARGANSVLVDSMESNKPSELYRFLEGNEYKIFPSEPELSNYIVEAIEDITIYYKKEVAIFDNIMKLDNEFQETENEKIAEERDSAIESLMENEQVCAKILEMINIYNIGINFKKVSE